jgi:hypothetical protein
MRKMFVVILIITAISSFYFAQPPSARADETKTFIGTIESFPYGFRFKSGPPLWPFGMIQVKTDNGEQNNFLIVGSGPRATIFYYIDGKNLGTVTASLSKAEVAKKVEIGKRVEVTYTTPPETVRFINRNLAISVRYVPADYVGQPAIATSQSNIATQAVPTANAYGEKVFAGKIESSSSTFHIPAERKIVIVADNGDRLTVLVSRDIAIRNMKAYPTRIGKRAEVKYSSVANGENEAISFLYLD